MLVLKDYFDEINSITSTFIDNDGVKVITNVIELLFESLKNKNKILLCGNGGSAADSQHFAAELVNSMDKTTSREALAALSLTTDTSVMTSIANDFAFERIFARQVEALGKSGDILVAFTTSGKSENILQALKTALDQGVESVVFCGQEIKYVKEYTKYIIQVPSKNTQHIQETHTILYHYICMSIEKKFSTSGDKN